MRVTFCDQSFVCASIALRVNKNSSPPVSEPLRSSVAHAVSADDFGAETTAFGLSNFGREVLQYALLGQHRRALSMALQVREDAIRSGHLGAELEALNLAARCHSMNNNALSALTSGLDALKLAEKRGDAVAAAHAHCSMASAAFALELLTEASPVLEQAIATAVEHRNIDLEVRARVTFGENLGDLGEFQRAEHQLQRAEALAQHIGHVGLWNRVLVRQATHQGKRAAAAAKCNDAAVLADAIAAGEVMVRRVRTYADSIGHVPYQAGMCGLLGALRMHEGRLEDALRETNRAIDLALQCQGYSAVAPWSLRISDLKRTEGDLEGAVRVLERALPVAESVRPTFRLVSITDQLAVLEVERGDASRAAEWRARADQERALFANARQEAQELLRSQSWGQRFAQ
jgi:tetratricopeptide (TPR) repeat protein